VTIVENRKAPHEYFIEERYEAGIALEGGKSRQSAWARPAEGSLRDGAGRGDFPHRRAHQSALGRVHARAGRSRAHAKAPASCEEIRPLSAKSTARDIRWSRSTSTTCAGASRSNIGLAKGKKQYDKRAAEKEKDWKRAAAALAAFA